MGDQKALSTARKLAALRALAERPGTPAEGEVARRKLAELEAKRPSDPFDRFAVYLRTGDIEDLMAACDQAMVDGVNEALRRERLPLNVRR